MKLFELAKPMEKAGFIPYIYEDDIPLFLFMVPSNAKFGGTMPQIAKGRVDKGETVIEAAYRETKEELGLRMSNIKHSTVKLVWKGKFEGKKESFIFSVYMCEVKNKDDFKKHDNETQSTHWLTAKEFAKQGKPTQVRIVQAASRLLSG